MRLTHFPYRAGRLFCEGVPAEQVAAAVGTPAYVYSRAAIEHNFRRFDRAFADYPHTICYSVKANSNLAVLALLARLGAGFDIGGRAASCAARRRRSARRGLLRRRQDGGGDGRGAGSGHPSV